jgi:hypothetical protein
MRSGRKNDTERHREALKRGIVFSAMGKKVFFNPHVELLSKKLALSFSCYMIVLAALPAAVGYPIEKRIRGDFR